MTEVRELREGESLRAAAALLELRPQVGSPEAMADRIDGQRAGGYRVVAAFDPDAEDAAAVAGFRIAENLAWGRFLYVDDLVTRSAARGRGHADSLIAWVSEEAERAGCGELHLDSGVGADREDAHRFYFRHRLRITSYHFARGLA
jgi:predicted GNAT superfamily acetyltransferase